MAQSTIYNAFKVGVLNGLFALASDTVKVALVNDSYRARTLSQIQSDVHYSDLSGYEISASGYTAGGNAITVSVTNSGNVAKLELDEALYTEWTANITAGGAVVYDATTGLLIGYQDFGSSITDNPTFKVDWTNASGVILQW